MGSPSGRAPVIRPASAGRDAVRLRCQRARTPELRTVRTIAVLASLCVLASFDAVAQPGGPFGTAQLQISGARLTIYTDSLTNDADQTLNVGEPGRVRTCYGAGAACGSTTAGAVPGLKVVGELSGPELPQAVTYEIAPGGTFFLPGFQREGDYLLENIRLVEMATDRVLANAEPSLATLHVRQILLASATVTRLTLAELQARGIALTQQNFQAFSFSVGFLFAGQLVNIELPVLFQTDGKILPLDKQKVKLDDLPDSVRHEVRRWEPPQIVPFSLNLPPKDAKDPPDVEPEVLSVPLYGAIVIPGNVSFLNQFFDARLIVANGAPNGSNATLQNVTGALRLPTDGSLRIAATTPPVSVGQKLPLTKANGSGVVGPGEQGTAGWTVEGLVAGTQTLRMEIAADLVRPGHLTLPLVGSVQAAVEVVDARFNLTFNHPDVVREGEAYSLYVTVTNLSRAAQNLVTVELLSQNITGAHQADPTDPFRQTIATLDPGASETLEFRLVSDTTGKCVATTFQSSSPGLSGTIHLRTGVGELGIPLSPASLVLPRFSELLPRALLTADVRLLGLAYSLAVAPAGAAPPGLPHVVKSDVVRRAVDLGEAGQRLYLQERLLESLEVLALDQMGNRDDLADYDTLRRSLAKGAAAATALSDLFRQEQQNRNLAAADFVDHFASTTDYGRPYLAAGLVPNGTQPLPVLEVRQVGASGTSFLARTSDDATRLRTVPYGEVYALADVPGGTTRAPFALVGRLDSATSYRVDLHAPATGASGRLILVVPTDDLAGFRKVDFGFVTMGANEVWEVRAVGAAGDTPLSFGLYFPTSGIPVPGVSAPAITVLQLPPFRVIGAVEDFTLDRYGLGLSYLFNRPPDKAAAETASSYTIRSTFHGQDTSSPPLTFDKVVTKSGGAAFWQPNSERVVDVRYQSPISALNGLVDGIPVIRHEHLLATNAIRDTHGTPLEPQVPAALIEPNHTGGLVDGRVLLGTGEPAAGAIVQLIRYHSVGTEPGGSPLIVPDLVAETTTSSDGAFYFDFIEEPPQNAVLSGFHIRATVPPGSDPTQQPGGSEEVSSTIRLQNRLVHVNIALLGRGTVKGTLVYADNGAPVPNGHVAAASTLFSEVKDVVVASDGSFTISALPVGPITLTGSDASGNRVYQTVALQQPGQTVNVALRIPRTTPPKTGTVIGRVLRQRSGTPLPLPDPSPGAQVAVYSNGAFIGQAVSDASGSFRFEKVPEGQVQVQAADFSISRTRAIGGAVLPADGTVSITLTLSDAAPRVVTGRVLFHESATNTDVPVQGAVAFIVGPGVFAYTDASGTYRIEAVPVQGAFDPPYGVTAIDFTRQLQGIANLPPILDVGDGSPIRAPDIVLRAMTGGVDGVVLDPLGHPIGGISVQIPFGPSTTTRSDGHFSFDDVGVGGVSLVAHAGNGLSPGKVGFFGTGFAAIVFGGHRPFATIRLQGSGVVNIHTRTATSTGVLSPIHYKPTIYRDDTYSIEGKPDPPIETTTDQDGRLQLIVPLGSTAVTAFSGFGSKSVTATLRYPGEVVNLEIVFDSLSTVTGHVVGVDGVTPVPDVDVFLTATGLLPQRQRADGQGGFRYELVPSGSVSVTTEALVGSVDRVGRADGRLTSGQTIDLTVVLRAQGTVKGRVFQLVGSTLVPIPFARYTISESAYPNRRLPGGVATYATDANGAYEVSHLFAGPITVVAADPGQVTRQGRATAEITSDFQVLQMPDIVLATSVGSLSVLVRDPETGSPVPDCQITLSNGDVTVSDAQGQASFDALPLGTYSVYAFHAPTGQGGVVNGLRLLNPGDHVDGTIILDTRGQISGTLWDDPPKSRGVGNGTVQLTGRVNGRLWGTSLTALASTSSDAATLGRFLFDGIPVGSFTLVAAVSDSARRASTSLDLTTTAPVAAVDLVLEQLEDRYVRIFQNLTAAPHLFEIDPSGGVFNVELTQPPGTCNPNCTYDFLLSVPTSPYPNHLFKFPAVYASRPLLVDVREASGEQRRGSISGLASLPGAGSASDPYRVVLGAKGTVNVLVRDGGGNPVSGATVTLTSSAISQFGSATDGSGRVTFNAVPGGNLMVSAKLSSTGFGGIATGVLTYDDETVDFIVNLAPAVSAHGIVYHPLAGDVYTGDPSSLVPEDKAIVQIRDSSNQLQIVQTGPDGKYRFNVLRTGAYAISASNQTGESVAAGAGTLAGPDGNDNALPDLLLDASRPLIVSLTPSPGQAGVSRGALVEIVFSEPLLSAVLPTGAPSSPYFTLRSGATGLIAVGTWNSLLNTQGQQIVRFTPSALYDNSTVYSLTIAGGPGGVRDRAGRPLTDSGDVGSNFTTSDTVGASVVGSVPPITVPVDPAGEIRFDFSEVVSGTASELDGDGVGDAAELFWQQNGSPTWQPIPITMFLTRGGYSLTVQPPSGVTYPNDSLKRRIHISRLRDVSGNPMAGYDQTFRIWDTNAPHVDVAFPPGAPGGDLFGGNNYVLTPALSSLDDPSNGPGGDIDRVDYFLASAGDPISPSPTPVYSGRVSPFAFSFVAAYVGNGVDPRPFPVWVQAVDTSTNKSNVVKLAMQVVPNAPPVVASVGAAALSPVAGTFYAGSAVRATAFGVADPDGSQVTLAVELRRDHPGVPNDPTDLVATPASRLVTRPPTGWLDLVPPDFDTSIPVSMAEGTSLFFRVKATDTLGAAATVESLRFAVAHDPNPPTIDSFVARAAGASSPATRFTIGQKFVVEFRARDAETAVQTVSLALSDVFASPQAATLVAGTTNLYRTGELTVPTGLPPAGTAVTATASATDWGANTGTGTLSFLVSPSPDPYAPAVEWISPWEGSLWPAAYTSVLSAQGAALLLRASVTDKDQDASGDIPGTIVSVEFRGPADAAGTLAAAFTPGILVPGTNAPGAGTYQLQWRVPNGVVDGASLPFEVRATDTGGNVTTQSMRMRASKFRKVYEGAQTAALPGDAILAPGGAASGPVFLLDGATLSVYPQTDSTVRTLTSLFIWAGAQDGTLVVNPSVLTAPEVTSYASSVLFYALELTVTDTMGLGAACRIDMSARGLLGSTPTQSMILPGQTGSQQYAGGSHGGSGTPGSPSGGFARTDLSPAGSVYDAVKDPSLPGGGGGYATGGTGTTPTGGGTGGGVVRLLAPGATMHLGGDVLADGGDGPGGFTGGGGAGGAIRIVAARIEGAGTLSAGGGRGTNGNTAGGGGGGRVSLSFADPPSAALALKLSAAGALNAPPPDANAQQRAGAGTIYVEETDAFGVPKAPGKLIVTNGSGKPAWPTPFSGAQRFGAVEAHGAARLVFDDDLSVGPVDPGALNDRASLALDLEARALLKPDLPQIALTASPDGGDVKTGQQLSASYTLSDPLGLFGWMTAFSPSGSTASTFADEPVTFSSGVLSLQVPASQPPGPITYSLQVSDRAGRSQSVTKSWTVLPDSPPSLALTALTPGPSVLPGTVLTATATASDDVGLTRVVFTLSGAIATSDTRNVNTASTVQVFSYTLPNNLAAGQTVALQVDAFDTFGHKTSASPVTYTIVADTVPPVITSVALSPVKAGDVYTTGDDVTFTVTATDNVALARINLTIGGNTTPFTSSPAVIIFRAPNVTGSTPFTLDVEVFDVAGNRSTASRTISVVPAGGGTFPVVSFTCPTAGAYLPSTYAAFQLVATASDGAGITKIEFFRPGDSTPFSTSTPPSGAPTSYVGTSTAITLPTVPGDTIVTYRARAWNAASHSTDVSVDVHVVPTVDIATAKASDVAVVRTGTVTLDTPKTFAGLVILKGAALTHSATLAVGAEKSLNLTVNGPTYVECGGAINVTGKGYPSGMTYPGAALSGAGGHLGKGGPGDTYGSVARPQEAGSNNGGGIVRISSFSAFVVDGTIAADGANGASGAAGGAGGSVWLTTSGLLAGSGIVQARGSLGSASAGGGGGGAVALEFGSSSGGVVANSRADAPNAGSSATGGAGTVLIKGPASQLGELRIDPRGVFSGPPQTVLPSFGSGTAQPGTSGPTLVTDRSANVPAYFAGHWVEVRASSGVLKGTWRIGTTPGAINAKTVTLVPNDVETLSLAPGDSWQGLYRFDSMRASAAALVSSGDPIEVVAAAGTTITGSGDSTAPFQVRAPLRGANLTLEAAVALGKPVDGGNLTVKSGAIVTPAFGIGLSRPFGLSISLSGALVVESGGAIDTSTYGYGSVETYPGAVTAGSGVGGGHLGLGGLGTPGGTFGSVTRPQEAGGGGWAYSGGGIVRVVAPAGITIDGAIRANGQDVAAPGVFGAGAGGSVWLTTSATLAGAGVIEASGGKLVVAGAAAGGGGGAVALEYGSVIGTVVANSRATGGTGAGAARSAGAGTIWTKGAASTFGDLLIDNGGTTGQATVLPSLGSGIVQAGSAGTTLVTDRAADIPAYFAGHWVEISNSSSALKGTCRISTAPGGIVARTVTLTSCSSSFSVDPLDKWQGVYIFDSVTTPNNELFQSIDPFRLGGNRPITLNGPTAAGKYLEVPGTVLGTAVTVTGNVSVLSIAATSLTVKSGAILTHPVTTASTTNSLAIAVSGALTLESGASIDATGRGYPFGKTYPGVAPTNPGASHVGLGGQNVNPALAYGSVYRPAENGAGVLAGGGAVRVTADSISFADATSLIRANGTDDPSTGGSGGAGGSVWITAASVSGNGKIEARGGDSQSFTGTGGGGGAVVVEYGTAAGTWTSGVLARGGAGSGGSGVNRDGGAGTALLKSASSTFGDLTVDDSGRNAPTVLPALGSGVAHAGSTGGTLVLDRLSWVAPFFSGNFVEVRNSSGGLKGTWRVESIFVPQATQVVADLEIDTQPNLAYDGYFFNSGLTLTQHFGGSAQPGFGNSHFFAARFFNGLWQYDNKTAFVTFTPDPSDRVFASFHKGNGTPTMTSSPCPGGACAPVNGVQTIAAARGRVRMGTFLNGTTDLNNIALVLLDLILASEPQRLVLEAPADVQPGDGWQGVYRFDSLKSPNGATLVSADLIRLGTSSASTISGATAGTQYLDIAGASISGPAGFNSDIAMSGRVLAASIAGSSLTIKSGATLTHPATGNTSGGPKNLTVNVSGALTLESNATIDVSGRGYSAVVSYPNTPIPGAGSGGSHLGSGGLAGSPLGATYGSIEHPSENGSGGRDDAGNAGYGAGGGAIRIQAGSVVFTDATSTVRANGNSLCGSPAGGAAGAGGSVWLTATGAISGDGKIEAKGGDCAIARGGGGGAVSLEYATTSGTVLANASAAGGAGFATAATNSGGAGSVFFRGPTSVYGDLLLNNAVRTGETTVLPTLGSGVAQPGSAGAALIVLTFSPVPAYAVGRWIDVSTSAGALKGTWRIGSITNQAPSGSFTKQTLNLLQNQSETIAVAPLDKWQAVYLLDSLSIKNGASLVSADPVRTASVTLDGTAVPVVGDVVAASGSAEVKGAVTARRIDAASLAIRAGATLSHPAIGTDPTKPERLTLNVAGTLTIESGATIDVTGKGYVLATTYPGATVSGTGAGGSHFGVGGTGTGAGGSTFGNPEWPAEAGGGAGGGFGSSGGGSVRIVAGTLAFGDATSAIRANGGITSYRTGAGGSVWITAGALSGDGVIEARGGDTTGVGDGRGGGGAIAIEYASASGTALSNLSARGGNGSSNGGPGTILVKGPGSLFGDLTIDRKGVIGAGTILPSLGFGFAQGGTNGTTLVTDHLTEQPKYFVGRWVEIRDASGTTLKGTWRITAASFGGPFEQQFFTLAPNEAEVIDILVGDRWQAVYRFDNPPTLLGGATLASVDPIRIGGTLLRAGPSAASIPAAQTIRSVSLCTDIGEALKPGGSFAICADSIARDLTLEISGAFEARIAAYGNCRDPIAIPGSAKPGPLTIVASARDAEGRTASATAHALVVADERAPVLVSVEPAPSAALRSGDPLRVAVEAWDDVGIASVAITLGGKRAILTAPPYEIFALAPPVASKESLQVVVEVFDPSGNVSRREIDLGVLPSGAPLPALAAAPGTPAEGISLADGRLAVDGGWPWRDADGETRGRTLELPAIGTHTVLAVGGTDGTVVALDGPVARAAVHGGSVDVSRSGVLVGRFRILSVSEDGTAMGLEGEASGKIREGDFLEGNWAFGNIDLSRGAILRAVDAVEARSIHVDASSLFLSKNLQIPSPGPAPRECVSRGARPDPPGTPPTPAGSAP